MKRPQTILLFLFSMLLLGQSAFAQVEGTQNEAWELARDGAVLISNGEFQKAVQKYSYASKLDPKNLDYQIGLAQAWFFAEDYFKSMDICRPLMNGRKARFEAYQIYGNCQDAQGKSYEALETYRRGLKRFPAAGVLYVEMGIVEAGRDRIDQALSYWEQGIVAQRTLPSNYYFAARSLFDRGDYAWAAAYAEIFITLERKGPRVREMSELLMACYQSARKFDYLAAYKWQFYQPKTANPQPESDTLLYQLLNQAFASEFQDTITDLAIADLIEIRAFVALYMLKQLPDSPMAGLWEWQYQILQNHHFEAYNYWLLYDARQDEFMAWFEENAAGYEAFEGWFSRDTFYRRGKHTVSRLSLSEKKVK